MKIFKKSCSIFCIILTTNIQASEHMRHVSFKNPVSVRHRYEIESLHDYHNELREHNLQISIQQDAIIREMSETDKIELATKRTAKLLIDKQKKAFLEPYNKINNTLKEQKKLKKQEPYNSHLSTLSVVIVGGISLYYFNYFM